MNLREWTDSRDARDWKIWLVSGDRPILVFVSEGDLFTGEVSLQDGLEDRSDAELQRLLDEVRGGE